MRTVNTTKRYIMNVNVDSTTTADTTTTTTTTTTPLKEYQIAICSPWQFNNKSNPQYVQQLKVTMVVDDSYTWTGYMEYGSNTDSFDRPDIITGYDWEELSSTFNYEYELPYDSDVIQRVNLVKFKNNIKLSIEPNLAVGPFYYISDLWMPTENVEFVYPDYTWNNEMVSCINYYNGEEYWLSGFEEIGPLYSRALHNYQYADQSSLDWAKTDFIISYDDGGFIIINNRRPYPVVKYNNTPFIQFLFDNNSGG